MRGPLGHFPMTDKETDTEPCEDIPLSMSSRTSSDAVPSPSIPNGHPPAANGNYVSRPQSRQANRLPSSPLKEVTNTLPPNFPPHNHTHLKPRKNVPSPLPTKDENRPGHPSPSSSHAAISHRHKLHVPSPSMVLTYPIHNHPPQKFIP